MDDLFNIEEPELEAPTERLFEPIHDGIDIENTAADDFEMEYHSRFLELVKDAVDYEMNYLAFDREENIKYYDGLLPALNATTDEGYSSADETPNSDRRLSTEGSERGRSSVVSTDVRDTVMAMMPSLMRIFASQENVVTFTPRTKEGEELAKQQMDYCNYVLWEENDGFMLIHGLARDALTVKAGIVKWWTKLEPTVETKTFHDITFEQALQVIAEGEAEGMQPEVVESEEYTEPAKLGVLKSFTVRYLSVTPAHKLCAVPPEEFRISRDAKSITDANIVGHERFVKPSELVEMGYDFDEVSEYMTTQSSDIYSTEKQLRNKGMAYDVYLQRGIKYGEWYVRIDGDGDGIDELRHICTIGDEYRIISDTACSHVRMAMWLCDPIPHTAIGDSIANITRDIQRIKTNMVRSMLDNLAESVNPKMAINELIVNVDDALNDEVGAVTRVRGDPNTAIAWNKIPFVGKDIFEGLLYVDRVRQARTGISEASKGLDPKALQSTSVIGVDAIVSGAQERTELVARIMAETGLRPMMKGLLREVTDNPSMKRTIRVNGKWVDVNPSLFDADMGVSVNPNMGRGSDIARLQALQSIKADQEKIIMSFGIDNPMVGPEQVRNTLEDILQLVNINNTERYFKAIDPALMEQIKNAPKEPTPEMLLAQAEMEKVKAQVIKLISEADENNREVIFKYMKLESDKQQRTEDRETRLSIEAARVLQQDGYNPALDPVLSILNVPREAAKAAAPTTEQLNEASGNDSGGESGVSEESPN